MTAKDKFFNTIFSADYFLKVPLHHILKIKSQNESQNSRNQGFSYYFCMMIEGSGSGSVPLTSGSGSGRPKNMWIRWILIRIRIRNTALGRFTSLCHRFSFAGCGLRGIAIVAKISLCNTVENIYLSTLKTRRLAWRASVCW
jgi:hypothetical protein